jgi:hypothetical protein
VPLVQKPEVPTEQNQEEVLQARDKALAPMQRAMLLDPPPRKRGNATRLQVEKQALSKQWRRSETPKKPTTQRKAAARAA